MSIITEHGYRLDGRMPYQIRNINYKLGVYSQADGSAYLEQGNTKVLCAVYGPHECRQRSRSLEDRCLINCQYSMATFSTNERKERPRGDRRTYEIARLLEKTFGVALLTKNYPRSQIDIFCELLQSDGSELAACVNAATLALSDAGVPLRGLVAAVSCAVGGSVRSVSDPTSEARCAVPCVDVCAREERSNIPRLTLATLTACNDQRIVLINLTNRIHRDRLLPVIAAARAESAQVHTCLQAAIQKHITLAIGIPADDDQGQEVMDVSNSLETHT